MRRITLPALAAIAVTTSCTIPTDAPVTDVRWVVPGQSTTIAVSSYLPTGVTLLPDNSAFSVAVPATTVTRQLSQDCAACAAANGLSIPKPAFTANASLNSSLPSGIASATLTSGNLQVAITNGLNFDPLRPNANTAGGATGYAVIVVSNGTTVLARDSVSGATTALAAGSTLTRNIALAGAITSNQPITATLTLFSPAGENVQMDASRSISITTTPQNLRVSSATVTLANKTITSSSTQDLTSIDSTIINHVQSGALLLTITNPFAATGNLTVTLAPAGGAPVVKQVTLGTGTTNVTIPFTGPEIQRLLGHNVTITYTGTVNATSGTVTVTPTQAVTVKSKLDLSLELGTIKQ